MSKEIDMRQKSILVILSLCFILPLLLTGCESVSGAEEESGGSSGGSSGGGGGGGGVTEHNYCVKQVNGSITLLNNINHEPIVSGLVNLSFDFG